MVVYKFVLKLFRVTDVADADADADDGNSDNKAISVQLSWGLTELGNKQAMLSTQSKCDLKWLRYGQNRNIIACHCISGTLAGG